MINKVFLIIGGNLGDRLNLIGRAKEAIEEKIGEIHKQSSIYETAPWGFQADQNFYNQVLEVNTELMASMVLKYCLEIENDLGRKRGSDGYTSRTMDIDILFFNDEIIQTKDLTIPHPRLHERMFTLKPLAEIAPGFIHPVFRKKLMLIVDECIDDSEVIRL